MYQKPSQKAVQPQGSGLILGHITGEIGAKPICYSQFYFGKVTSEKVVQAHQRLYAGSPSGSPEPLTIDNYFVLGHYTPNLEKFMERVRKRETGVSLLENLTHVPIILSYVERNPILNRPESHKYWSIPAIVKGATNGAIQLYQFPIVDGTLHEFDTVNLEIVGADPIINPATADKFTMASFGSQARDMIASKEREIKANAAKVTKAFDEFKD